MSCERTVYDKYFFLEARRRNNMLRKIFSKGERSQENTKLEAEQCVVDVNRYKLEISNSCRVGGEVVW